MHNNDIPHYDATIKEWDWGNFYITMTCLQLVKKYQQT